MKRFATGHLVHPAMHVERLQAVYSFHFYAVCLSNTDAIASVACDGLKERLLSLSTSALPPFDIALQT